MLVYISRTASRCCQRRHCWLRYASSSTDPSSSSGKWKPPRLSKQPSAIGRPTRTPSVSQSSKDEEAFAHISYPSDASSSKTTQDNETDPLQPLPRPKVHHRDRTGPRNPVKPPNPSQVGRSGTQTPPNGPQSFSTRIPPPNPLQRTNVPFRDPTKITVPLGPSVKEWPWESYDSPDPEYIREQRHIYSRPWERGSRRQFSWSFVYLGMGLSIWLGYYVIVLRDPASWEAHQKEVREQQISGPVRFANKASMFMTNNIVPFVVSGCFIFSYFNFRNSWKTVHRLTQVRVRPQGSVIRSDGSVGGAVVTEAVYMVHGAHDGLWLGPTFREIDPKTVTLSYRTPKLWERGEIINMDIGAASRWKMFHKGFALDFSRVSDALKDSGQDVVVSLSRLEAVFGRVRPAEK